jgi:uncharacterized SAM-binding protein YcdF (DUF218 family)
MKSSRKQRFQGNRFFFRIFLGLCISIFFVILIEGLYFAWILKIGNTVTQSDIILIFKGSQKRTEAGYRLANLGLAPRIVLSPATGNERQQYDRTYTMKDTVSHIPEEQATTTFENALFTSLIIKAYQLKSVILVTSDYHMPRSLVLLRLFLMGTNVRVRMYQVEGRELFSNTLSHDIALLKLTYNEMVECWGSLFEFAAWYSSGKDSEYHKRRNLLSPTPSNGDPLPTNHQKNGSFMHFLRSLILLDIEPEW